MLGVNVTYTMKPGKRDSFLAEIAASGAQKAVRTEPGCMQYDYFLSAEDPDKLFLLEKWADREAQAVHMNQPHMAQIADIKQRYTLNTALELYQL